MKKLSEFFVFTKILYTKIMLFYTLHAFLKRMHGNTKRMQKRSEMLDKYL